MSFSTFSLASTWKCYQQRCTVRFPIAFQIWILYPSYVSHLSIEDLLANKDLLTNLVACLTFYLTSMHCLSSHRDRICVHFVTLQHHICTYNVDQTLFSFFTPSSKIIVTSTQFQECFHPLVIDTFRLKQQSHQKFVQTFHPFFQKLR